MHLRPVYLLAPKPKPPSIPTRRAFLIAGATFFVGAAAGGACGYATGADKTQTIQPPTSQFADALKPTGDSTLDELRRLAVESSIEELVSKWQPFLAALNDKYPDDATLWLGAERICEEIIANENIANRRHIAGWAIQAISYSQSSSATQSRQLLNQLRRIR